MRRSEAMRFVEVGPGALEYELIGGDGSPIVFLHEGLGSIAQWRDFPRRVCSETGRAGLVYSRHGHGFSDPPREARTSRFLHDEAGLLAELLATFRIEHPVLVGHSDGATIALLYAAARSVAGVVSIAHHVFVEDVTLDGIRRAVASGVAQKLAKYHRDADAMFGAWAGTWLSDDFRDWDVRGEVRDIAAPVLVIYGSDDPYGSPAQAEPFAERLIFEGAGHAPHFERPDETIAAVAAFIRGLAG